MDYLAACGLSPIEVISRLTFEQAIDIDSLMVVKQTSNTISSKGQNTGNNGPKAPAGITNPNKGKIGRPETDNPTDDTDRLDDAQ